MINYREDAIREMVGRSLPDWRKSNDQEYREALKLWGKALEAVGTELRVQASEPWIWPEVDKQPD